MADHIPSQEFIAYTDGQLRAMVQSYEGRRDVTMEMAALRGRMLKELAIRKSCRLDGQRVIVQAQQKKAT